MRMEKSARVKVTAPGTSITGWFGTVDESLPDGSAGWVRFDKPLPVSLRTSTKRDDVLFLSRDQVETA